MKSILKILGLSCILASLTATACFADTTTNQNTSQQIVSSFEYTEVITEAFNTNTPIPSDNENDSLLFHNNGYPMESDCIFSTDSEDNLIAVYQTEINGVQHRTKYFSERDIVPKAEMLETLAININKLTANTINNSSKATSAHASYSEQTIWEIAGNGVEAVVTSSSEFYKNPNHIHAGAPASAWIVSTLTDYDRRNATRLNSIKTSMLASYEGQTLIKYAPLEDYSGTSISGSFTYGSLPTVDYDFTFGGFTMSDESRLSSQYASWLYEANTGTNDDLTYYTLIGAANTTGKFTYGLGHVINLNSSGTSKSVSKGTTYSFTDR